MMKRRTPDTAVGGLDLIEESVHALRLAPPGALLCYYVGAVPFVLAALFFWSDMSRSGMAEQHLIPGATGLSILFVWMKFWQSAFALKLSTTFAREPSPKITVGHTIRAAAAQSVIQTTAFLLLPVSAVIMLPLGWVFAFYQNATVLGLRELSLLPLLRRSWQQARYGPMQNHAAMLVLTLFGFFVLLNVAITMVTLPQLLKMLVGVETDFTLSFESSLNTTFLAAALGVTYLCFDPLLKAAYTMRCFYGEARATGEDLRVALRGFRSAALAGLILLLTFASTFSASAAIKTETQNVPQSEKGAALDRSIEDVLKRPEYTWRAPRAKAEVKAAEESTLLKRLREWGRNTARSIRDWLEKLFRSTPRPAGAPGFSFSAEGLIYILIAVALAIIGVLAWLLWRTRSRSAEAELEATPATPVPDLESNDVAGDELPVDGWTKLALELLERGELRLAMRAFYFSSLAHLAARNLVNIAKFKSNRDYERELLRRSHALPELTRNFSDNVFVFDRVWYGMHEIDADLIQQFRGNVERIKEC